MTSLLRSERRARELAGLADNAGLIGNPVLELEDALVPIHVEHMGDALLYIWPPKVGLFEYRDSDPINEALLDVAPTGASAKGMLDWFVSIRTADDVVAFARRYGVIGCCRHDLPSAHRSRDPLEDSDDCDQMQFPFCGLTSLHWEPVHVWFRLASGARALLEAVSAIYEGNKLARADRLEAALESVWGPVSPGLMEVLADGDWGRETAVLLVNRWLAIGGVSHGLIWREGQETPELRLMIRATHHSPTAGILASQLMLAIGRAHDLTRCDGCGGLYMRQLRRPQRGRRNYCSPCRNAGIPNRLAQRESRARRRGDQTVTP